MDDKRVFVALHLYREPEEPVFYSCMKTAAKLLKQHGYTLEFDIVWGDPYIQKARNKLVHNFLKSNSNIFIFIADDIEYTPNELLLLIETPGDVVCGAYSQHVKPVNYPVKIYTDDTGYPVTRGDGCISAKRIQTGFLRINRVVFERIILHHPELSYYGTEDGKQVNVHCDFFPQGVHHHRWIGEDYAFCDLWTGLGGKIWIIPDLNLTHWKRGEGYAGNYHEYLMRLPGGCKEGK